MTVREAQNEIIEEFEFLGDSWEDKYAHIIALGKELPTFPEEHKNEATRVHGCQSQVWLLPNFDGTVLTFNTDSDALIVKGLTALLVRVYSGKTPSDILQTPIDFIQKIGLDSHLSMNRANGLSAMVKKIQHYAATYERTLHK